MSEPIHILSLGAGVQSSTMALMAAMGEITPMPVAAVFADTQAEPKSVYTWLDWLEKQLPFPVHRITAGSLEEKSLRERFNKKTGKPYYSTMIPAFVVSGKSRGMLTRKCTYDEKVIPIVRESKRLAKIHNSTVVQWIGISLDEVSRMKDSREKKIVHRWPLVDLRMTRHDCLRWMKSNGFSEPPKSACVFCPYHNNALWARMKSQEPAEFLRAVEYEKRFQAACAAGGAKQKPFLHSSLRPLSEVDFSTEEERGQLNMFNNECEGMCGV